MKKVFVGILIGMCVTISFSVIAELVVKNNTYPIYVNGVKKDIEGYNINDRTYLQLKGIGEAMGTKVDFNEKEEIIIGEAPQVNSDTKKEFIFANDGVKARLYDDDKYYVAQWDIEKKYKGDYAFKIKDDETYWIGWRDTVFFDTYPQRPSYVELTWYNTVLQPWLANEGWKQ